MKFSINFSTLFYAELVEARVGEKKNSLEIWFLIIFKHSKSMKHIVKYFLVLKNKFHLKKQNEFWLKPINNIPKQMG